MSLKESDRYRYEQLFWRAQLPIVLAIKLKFPGFYEQFVTLYISFLSLYALDLTAGGANSAAKSAELVEGNDESSGD